MYGTPHKKTLIEKHIGVPWGVELGEAATIVIVYILVLYSETQDRKRGVKQIVRGDKERIIDGLKERNEGRVQIFQSQKGGLKERNRVGVQ